ncbi:MAG: 1-acyl-sn-glycerol-3-phosphate acyltransferase [Clostridiales bacterium]|nr:1-acyl-sn-glycerol-3-phosphate acyltransferase [Clostridiales bacterium]
MRTLLIIVFFLLFFAISIPILMIAYIIGLFSISTRFKLAQFIIKKVAKIILWLGGTNLKVIGTERVPKGKPVVYILNHRSYFDAVICYATVPNMAGFISMKTMQRVPFINIWMKYLGCLFLDRTNVRQGLVTIKAGVQLIKRGLSIFIAPEGKRNLTGEIDMLPFKEGSFKLAKKTGCAIIPVAINNADKIFETQFPWVRKRKVSIEYGYPIYTKDLDLKTRKNTGEYVQNIIKGMLERNQIALM